MRFLDPRKWTRATVFFIASAAFALVVWLAYAQVMLLPEPASATKDLDAPAVERGPILDRDGRLLAISTKAETATWWSSLPPEQRQTTRTAALLAPILGLDEATLAEDLAQGPAFQYVKRKLTAREASAVREAWSREEARVAAERDQGQTPSPNALAGVRLVPEPGRSYPEGELAASLIGFVGLDNVGLAGIEYALDDRLSPRPEAEASRTGTGASVWLTIDSVLQQAVQSIADRARRENLASRVNILVVEATTGEIPAWVTVPSFDPNRYAVAPPEVRDNALQTRAYEPGSVFKIFSIATLLDSGLLRPWDTFEANGAYERKIASTGEVIRIRDLASYGRIDVAGILEHSSNAGTGYASDRMEAGPFEEGLKKFGFGAPTAVGLSGETAGLLRPAKEWSARSKPTIAMGQEIGVSALQIVQAATVLANEGVMLQPRVVRRIQAADGEVLVQTGRTEVRQVISAETARTVLGMLRGTVDVGTGKKAQVEGYEIAGKTGTAQVRDPATGRYSDSNFLASVLLYLPASQPRYIVYLTIENPRGASYLGGQIAAPVGRQVLEKLIQLKGLPRTGEPLVVHPGTAKFEGPPTLTLTDTLPDLTGLPKRALLPLLSRPGLRVDLRGEGWVTSQSPAPGTPLVDGLAITVTLE